MPYMLVLFDQSLARNLYKGQPRGNALDVFPRQR